MAGGNLNEDIAQCLPVSVSLGGVKDCITPIHHPLGIWRIAVR